MQCRCPNCRSIFDCSSPDFGKEHVCRHCGHAWVLDAVNLVRYKLPEILTIRLFAVDGNPFLKFRVPVLVRYGFSLPPLLTDVAARVMVTMDMMLKAMNDEISANIAGKHDYSTNRYITIEIPDHAQAIEMAKKRNNSGLSIRPYEKELHGDIYTLCAAYVPEEDIVAVTTLIDLATEETEINVSLTVRIRPQRSFDI